MINKLIRITTIPISLEKLLGGQMAYMKDYFEIVAVSSDKSTLIKVGKEEGVDVFCVEMTRQITLIKDIKALCKLYGFLKREKPLIVHTHTPKAGIVGMLAAWLVRVPCRLHTVAGMPLLEAVGFKRIVLNSVEKLTYACATNIYPNSYGLQDIIIQNEFCSTKKLKVIANGSSNGIDKSYFNKTIYSNNELDELRNDLDLKQEDFIFIFVGRLVSDKGINELIDSFNKISKKYAFAKLLLVGSMESELDPLKENTIEIINFNKSIISVGWQSDVRPYFAISDALVFPSYREGFPNVVMQAGAMELPSIVTNINGCNEIIIEGENGVIIPPKNTEALKEKMEMFITDKNLLLKLKSKAREMIISRYEQKMVWESLLEEYKRLEDRVN